MDPKALILDAKIDEARALLVDKVKRAPADQRSRSLLFQVMLLCGEWDKARRQLEIAGTQQASPDMNLPVYQNLIQAELERAAVAGMEQAPTFFPDIPAFSETYFEARELLARNRFEEAAKRFAAIDAGLPELHGTINGEPFAGFRETDTLLTYFIEAIEYERYLWVPMVSIRELAVFPPKTLLDLVWAKGRITTWEGLTMGCFLPALYPGSYQSDDDQIRLGRLTDWLPMGGGFSKAAGQHVFQVGETDKGIFELGEVIFKLSGRNDEVAT